MSARAPGLLQRAYLGEKMPMPELPSAMRRADGGKTVEIDGVACEDWVEEIAGVERTHV